ncbi:hypothetical protein EJ02DRAFT_363516 [Clathrospora elynae]|uniref:CFEM domain-containing protein n=1 Tax=Clathrospora elynae TaxID=706981 RepID=A0A6A5S324_9PLEO|nr:hypothetical protein EJ02DRAFT_363516 [Clathrospora elynae]
MPRQRAAVDCLVCSGASSLDRNNNTTQACAKGNFAKYHCLDNAKLSTWLSMCLHECQAKANQADGCAPDDFACHYVNYHVYSGLIEHCAFPTALGGHGICTIAELSQARPVINDLCNFFNATLYADYLICPQKLSAKKTYGIILDEEIVASS